MTPDLQYLTLAGLLCLVQAVIAVIGAIGAVGLPTLAGNREPAPTIGGWAGRAARAHQNMLESLIIFAIVILVAQASGRANDMTALGAAVFFWARVAYVPVYLAGIPWVRTGVWGLSIVGILLVAAQLI
ncbi:MAG: MAPEG family protein [Alphaproteobacteria bacterium]|nr:MAPEG family protein [Alphaproteobacteria bacterium]